MNWAQQIAASADRLVESGEAEKIRWTTNIPRVNREEALEVLKQDLLTWQLIEGEVKT